MRSHACLAFAVAICAAPLAHAAAPPTWIVDKAASKLAFTSSFGGIGFDGSFRTWDAQIAFDPKALATSKVVVSIDTKSVTTGNGERDEALPTADWFSVAKYPKATFQATKFTALGGNKYQAAGTLTLRGVSAPVNLPFTLVIAGGKATMDGVATVNRGQFGVGQGQFKGGDTVPLPVTVKVHVVATQGK